MESEGSLIRELESVGGKERKERDAKARACRLVTRGNVSEQVFDQEILPGHYPDNWSVIQPVKRSFSPILWYQ